MVFRDTATVTARKLRREATAAERKFWNIVRNRRMDGKKFLRQYPIRIDYYGEKRYFIADFYCAESRLIVELDGGIHEKQKEYDAFRTSLINKLGIKVVRFDNKELDDVNEVVKRLKLLLK